MNNRGIMDLGMYNFSLNVMGYSVFFSFGYVSFMWSQGGGLFGGDDYNVSVFLGNMLGEFM